MTDGPAFVYVILAHRDLEQAERLIHRIQSDAEDAFVVLHVDARTPLIAFSTCDTRRLHVLDDRITVTWGSWSIVEAELRALAWAQAHLDYDWLCIVSGTDYPVRHVRLWQSELRGEPCDAVMTFRPVTIHPRWGRRSAGDGTFVRYAYRWFSLERVGRAEARLALRTEVFRRLLFAAAQVMEPLWALRILPRGAGLRVGVRVRHPFTRSRPCYKGDQWLALARPAVEAVLAAVDQRGPLVRRFRGSLIPDEAFVQTLVVNDDALVVRLAPLTATRFGDGWSPHPVDVDEALISSARDSGTPFARKFTGPRRQQLLDLSDSLSLQDLRDTEVSRRAR